MTSRLIAVAVLAFAAPAFAQQGQTVGVVTQDEVVVRGSPRADGPDTGTLPRGTTVIVHHAEGAEWLAIQPPRGAVSWVNHKFIRPLVPGSDPANPGPSDTWQDALEDRLWLLQQLVEHVQFYHSIYVWNAHTLGFFMRHPCRLEYL